MVDDGVHTAPSWWWLLSSDVKNTGSQKLVGRDIDREARMLPTLWVGHEYEAQCVSFDETVRACGDDELERAGSGGNGVL